MANQEKRLNSDLSMLRSKLGSRPRAGRKSDLQRRRTERRTANKKIFLWRYEDGSPCEPETAVIMDISTSGIGIILAAPMKKGDQFLVHLSPLDSSLVYSVVRCRLGDDFAYRIGAEFIHRVAASEAGSLEQDIERIRRAILE